MGSEERGWNGEHLHCLWQDVEEGELIMRTMTVKTPAKVSGVPDAEVSVSPAEFDGQQKVLAYVRAVTPMDSKVVAQLAMSPAAARDLAARLVVAADKAEGKS